MPIILNFKPSLGGNAIYLAQLARPLKTQPNTPPGSEPITAEWAEKIHPFAEALASCLASLGLDTEFAWLTLLNAATQWESNQELAAGFLRRTQGASALRTDVVARLAAAIGTLESAVRNEFPDIEKELALRIGPLREHWEARGPGIMHRLATTTDPDLQPPEATVAIVSPVLGGGGVALLASNTVVFEGVLANGDAALPEVVRLAWLVAQLQLDLPKFSESISPARLSRLAPLALLPPILEAAAFVELIPGSPQPSPESLANAIRLWRLPSVNPEATAEILQDWWDAQVDSKVPWRVALAGLERLIDVEPL